MRSLLISFLFLLFRRSMGTLAQHASLFMASRLFVLVGRLP